MELLKRALWQIRPLQMRRLQVLMSLRLEMRLMWPMLLLLPLLCCLWCAAGGAAPPRAGAIACRCLSCHITNTSIAHRSSAHHGTECPSTAAPSPPIKAECVALQAVHGKD